MYHFATQSLHFNTYNVYIYQYNIITIHNIRYSDQSKEAIAYSGTIVVL